MVTISKLHIQRVNIDHLNNFVMDVIVSHINLPLNDGRILLLDCALNQSGFDTIIVTHTKSVNIYAANNHPFAFDVALVVTACNQTKQ